MNLDDAEPRLTSPAGGGGKTSNYVMNAIKCERLRHRIIVGETQCAWGDNFFPATFALENSSRRLPWPACAGFAAGMGQLHSGDAPLFMNEPDDSTQHLDVPVVPDAEVLRADPSLRQNRRRLGKYQSGAANRAAAEMNQMPVVSVSILARILAH